MTKPFNIPKQLVIQAYEADDGFVHLKTEMDLSLKQIANWYNPILQGWLNYYGCYCRSALYSLWRHFNKTLVAWAMRKYKHFQNHKTRALVLKKLKQKRNIQKNLNASLH
jgi:RNA-directed DNA polymerase